MRPEKEARSTRMPWVDIAHSDSKHYAFWFESRYPIPCRRNIIRSLLARELMRRRGKSVGVVANVIEQFVALQQSRAILQKGVCFRHNHASPSGHPVQSPVTQPTEIRISARPHARYSGSRLKNNDQ